jgi:CheY-like chemotaxis protein
MKRKILIIDDYQPLQEEVQEYLQYEGYEVITASNGAEGIQKAIIHKPDMILCDILMPELDGYEVFKTLQTIPHLSYNKN